MTVTIGMSSAGASECRGSGGTLGATPVALALGGGASFGGLSALPPVAVEKECAAGGKGWFTEVGGDCSMVSTDGTVASERSWRSGQVAYCEGNVTGAGSERLDGVRLSRGLFAAAEVTIDRGVMDAGRGYAKRDGVG